MYLMGRRLLYLNPNTWFYVSVYVCVYIFLCNLFIITFIFQNVSLSHGSINIIKPKWKPVSTHFHCWAISFSNNTPYMTKVINHGLNVRPRTCDLCSQNWVWLRKKWRKMMSKYAGNSAFLFFIWRQVLEHRKKMSHHNLDLNYSCHV